jgi:hypothetical protein
VTDTGSTTVPPVRRLHPSIPFLVFALLWVIASFIFPERLISSDGDLLRHIRHGDYMLAHGGLITADPFSYTRGGQAFVGFEYGSQLIFALVHRAAGLAGVALFAGLLIGTSFALLARFLLLRGVDPLLTYLVSMAAGVLNAVHWLARPHLFTLLFVVALLYLLEPGSRRRIWLLVPLFAVWANLHGGWVFGLILLGIYLTGSLGEMLLGGDRKHWGEHARYYGIGLVVAAAATLLTPHGLALHAHIFHFFGAESRFLLDNTHEFQSPNFHTPTGKIFLVVLLGVVAVLAGAARRPVLARFLATLAMIAFSLQAQRNIALFGVVVLSLLALEFDRSWRKLPDWRGIRAVFERDARLGRTVPYAVALTLALGVLAALHGRVGGLALVPDRVSSKRFPVEVVRRARAAGVTGRTFHEFTWGGYLLYGWPEQKVFIDGGTDFYGPEVMRTHSIINSMQPGWRDSLASWEISVALLGTRSALAPQLLREPGWRLRICDATAVLLQRTADSLSAVLQPEAALRACADSTGTGGNASIPSPNPLRTFGLASTAARAGR